MIWVRRCNLWQNIIHYLPVNGVWYFKDDKLPSGLTVMAWDWRTFSWSIYCVTKNILLDCQLCTVACLCYLYISYYIWLSMINLDTCLHIMWLNKITSTFTYVHTLMINGYLYIANLSGKDCSIGRHQSLSVVSWNVDRSGFVDGKWIPSSVSITAERTFI